jgi:hypothetical protein
MNDWVKLSGINEVASDALSEFAEKRGAKKIADTAKEKGGPSLLLVSSFQS